VNEYSLAPHHLRVLQVCCEAWDRQQQARKVLDEEGITVVGSRGQLQPHPATIVEKDSRIAFLRALRELNLDADQGPGVS
jgi:P27 family predicted phage terminase small subunit